MNVIKRFASLMLILVFTVSMSLNSYALVAVSTPAYPFGLGSVLDDQVQAREMLCEEWEDWKENYLSKSGSLRVISVDKDNTTSEGMGFGLLLSVYFNEKTTFDNLYGYVKVCSNANGLMNWKTKDGQIVGAGTDTGADENIALALIFANSMWGSNGDVNYANEARTLLDNIHTHSITSNYINPGDSFDSPKFLSQVAPGWYDIFEDFSGQNFWSIVKEKEYSLVLQATNPSTGLFPDRCIIGGASLGSEFGYEAIQLIFRMAVSYSWYGDANAKNYLSKMLVFFNNIGAENIVDGYALNGTKTRNNHSPAFVSAIAAGFMTGTSIEQAKEFYEECYTTKINHFYNATFRLLSLMYMTGNFQNLYAGGRQIQQADVSNQSDKPSDTTGVTVPLILNAAGKVGYISLTWNSIAGVKGYYVFKSTVSGGQTTTPETDFWVTGTTFEDKKTDPGTKYYYIVRPVLQDNSLGAASNEVSAVPLSKSTTIELIIGDPYMKINNASKEIDTGKGTAPSITNGRTFLPIRTVIEELGGTIEWDGKEKKITIHLNNKTAELWIGKKDILIDGTKKALDVAPYISTTNRTMIPLRFIEGLGCVLAWEGGAVQKATIVCEGLKTQQQDAAKNDDSTKNNDNKPDSGKEIGTWLGTWFTDYGRMDLTQSGNEITGTYGEEKHTIRATVSGNKLIGTYNEYGSIEQIEFNMASDGLSFVGIFGENTTPKDEWSQWSGKRERDVLSKNLRILTTLSNWAGTWETDYGKMVLTQNGNTVTGTYGENAYTIEGTVSNNKLTGMYNEDGSVCKIEFYMDEGDKSFKGSFGDDQSPRQDWSTWDGNKLK